MNLTIRPQSHTFNTRSLPKTSASESAIIPRVSQLRQGSSVSDTAQMSLNIPTAPKDESDLKVKAKESIQPDSSKAVAAALGTATPKSVNLNLLTNEGWISAGTVKAEGTQSPDIRPKLGTFGKLDPKEEIVETLDDLSCTPREETKQLLSLLKPEDFDVEKPDLTKVEVLKVLTKDAFDEVTASAPHLAVAKERATEDGVFYIEKFLKDPGLTSPFGQERSSGDSNRCLESYLGVSRKDYEDQILNAGGLALLWGYSERLSSGF